MYQKARTAPASLPFLYRLSICIHKQFSPLPLTHKKPRYHFAPAKAAEATPRIQPLLYSNHMLLYLSSVLLPQNTSKKKAFLFTSQLPVINPLMSTEKDLAGNSRPHVFRKEPFPMAQGGDVGNASISPGRFGIVISHVFKHMSSETRLDIHKHGLDHQGPLCGSDRSKAPAAIGEGIFREQHWHVGTADRGWRGTLLSFTRTVHFQVGVFLSQEVVQLFRFLQFLLRLGSINSSYICNIWRSLVISGLSFYLPTEVVALWCL